MTAPKVLFLDVDGVLNNVATFRDALEPQLDPACLARLRRVQDETGALVVLSSSWRNSPMSVETLHRAGVLARRHDDWRTPDLVTASAGGILVARTRGDEIRDWLSRHPEVTSWAAVDDEETAQGWRSVRTDFETGMTDADVRRLVAILGRRGESARQHALLRGLLLAFEDLALAGGGLTEVEALERFDGNLWELSLAADDGSVLAVTMPDGTRGYPAAQFGNDGLRRAMPAIMDALPTRNGWTALNFLVRPSATLGGRSPIACVADGDLELVLAAARVVGVQGA